MLRKLILEIHRRSLWQVLGIYAVGSWVAFEVISALVDAVGLPAWVPAFAIVLFLLGLPVVLATAFVQEGMPGQRTTGAAGDVPDIDPTLLPSLADNSPAIEPRTTPDGTLARSRRADMWLTWRRSLLSGVVAFLLLGLTAGGYMGLRNAGVGPFGSLVASGALDESAPVLLAGFDHVSGDTLLADALTAAFRIDFSETGIVTLVERRQVSAALQRMGRDQDERLTQQLALEIAARENIPAVITGEVRAAAGSTLLTVSLLKSDGAPLASYRETAGDSSDILPALDRLSKKLREKLGESLRTVHAGKPLEEVTTPSLEALRRYSRGVEALDVQRDFPLAIMLLKEAVALDSTFAMAWRKLAVAYGNMGNAQALAVDATTRAYRFSDRLTDSERYQAVGLYHLNVSGDNAQGIAAYRAGADAAPSRRSSYNNLAILYLRQREWGDAEAAAQRVVDQDSLLVVGYVNLIHAQLAQNKPDAAEQTLALLARRHGATSPDALRIRVQLDLLQGEYARADSIVDSALEFIDGPMRGGVYHTNNVLRLLEGHLREAERQRAMMVALQRQNGVAHAWLNEASSNAWTELIVRLDPHAARAIIDRAMAENDFAAVPLHDRPYFELIALHAYSGDAARARALLAEYERLIPRAERGDVRQELAIARGQVAFAEGRAQEALELLRAADGVGGCTFCGPLELATTFDALAEPDSAAVHYERYLATRHLFRGVAADGLVVPRFHERLAEIYDARGETQKAILHAAKFTELWKNADAELQPRVRAKQEMIARLRQS